MPGLRLGRVFRSEQLAVGGLAAAAAATACGQCGSHCEQFDLYRQLERQKAEADSEATLESSCRIR
jgi:hypothetical protein